MFICEEKPKAEKSKTYKFIGLVFQIIFFFWGLWVVYHLASLMNPFAYVDPFQRVVYYYFYVFCWGIYLIHKLNIYWERKDSFLGFWLLAISIIIATVWLPIYISYNYSRDEMLYYAARRNHTYILRGMLLFGNKRDLNNALIGAINEERTELVKNLILEGADVNGLFIGEHFFIYKTSASSYEKDEDGKTPLMIAAKNGRLELIKILLCSGADKTVKDKSGKTAEEMISNSFTKSQEMREILNSSQPCPEL